MQSATPISQAEYDHGLILTGKWCYNYGNAEAQGHYSALYGIYLKNGGMTTTVSQSAVTPTPRGRRVAAVNANTQTKAVTPTKAAAPTRRQRTTPGTVGPQDGKVLAKVVATPGITTEALRKVFTRNPTLKKANILGTAVGRLLKGGYMTGTEKVGPFTATETGIAAVKNQPISINAPRNRRAAQSTTTEGAQPQAQAG